MLDFGFFIRVSWTAQAGARNHSTSLAAKCGVRYQTDMLTSKWKERHRVKRVVRHRGKQVNNGNAHEMTSTEKRGDAWNVKILVCLAVSW